MVADGRSKVLVAGGGVAAFEAVLALRDLAAGRAQVELLAPRGSFTYEPLSVTGPFAGGESVTYALDELAERCGATHVAGRLTGIDAWRRVAHTSTNAELEYDVLLVACGALPVPAVPGATPFRGSPDIERLRALLAELERGQAGSLAVAIPGGATWSLPAYELALLTAAHLREHGRGDVRVTVVTPEAEPLQLFGPPASVAISDLLDASGIELRSASYAIGFENGSLALVPGPALEVDRVAALPRLAGAPLDGIPQTRDGFVPVDAHGRVHGLDDVYAAGDITTFTVKQGGLATQQADAAAEAIAARLGAELEPRRFRPVLRGLLLTGSGVRYLRRELTSSAGQEPVADLEPLWWPPAKVVGRYLAPFLAEVAGARTAPGPPPTRSAIDVAVELDVDTLARTGARRLPPHPTDAGEARVGDVMTPDPIVVAADVTLGEVAERLVGTGATAAAVVERDALVGILTAADTVRAAAARVQPDELPVRQWMTAEPVTVPPTYPVSAAALLMSEYGIHHLPVVHAETVVGMVSLEDLLAAKAIQAVERTGASTI